MQAIWLSAQGQTVGATSKVTSFGSRWIGQSLERYDASGPDALADGRRRNGLKPSLLTPEVLEAVRLRLGGPWSRRKVADVMPDHLGLERVLPRRGWEALKALGVGRCSARGPGTRTRPRARRCGTCRAACPSRRSPS